MESLIDRRLPFSLEAEQSLLGLESGKENTAG